jgi:hypothetical protein
LLAHGRWFSPGTASSTTKTGRHDIAEILLKVSLMIGLYELLGNPTTYLIEPSGPLRDKNGHRLVVKKTIELIVIMVCLKALFSIVYHIVFNDMFDFKK